MDNKDKVTITLSLERNVNGTITRKVNIDGEGFHFFELVGLMQICCYEFAQQSQKTASELPQDQPVNIVFNSGSEKV